MFLSIYSMHPPDKIFSIYISEKVGNFTYSLSLFLSFSRFLFLSPIHDPRLDKTKKKTAKAIEERETPKQHPRKTGTPIRDIYHVTLSSLALYIAHGRPVSCSRRDFKKLNKVVDLELFLIGICMVGSQEKVKL